MNSIEIVFFKLECSTICSGRNCLSNTLNLTRTEFLFHFCSRRLNVIFFLSRNSGSYFTLLPAVSRLGPSPAEQDVIVLTDMQHIIFFSFIPDELREN